MTFKPIDLQMSIPRTQEASGYHAGQLARPAAEQQQLANAAEKQTERNRQISAHVEESENRPIRDGQPKEQGGRQRGGGKRDAAEDGAKRPAESAHPYKGKHIDISF